MPFWPAVAIAFLAGFTDIRALDIQSVELVAVGALMMALMSPTHRFRIAGPAVIIALVPRIMTILLLVFFGSLLSLRLHFYPPGHFGILKQPPWATFVRFIEVVISISSLFIVALAVRNDPRRLKLLLAAYVWAALFNAIWGIISFGGWLGGIDLPGVIGGSQFGRMRGFFGEGGPLGVYLVGGIVVQIIRGFYLKYISRQSCWIGLAVLFAGLLGSQSKAALMVLIAVLTVFSLKQGRIVLVCAGVALLLPIAAASNVTRGLNGYYINFLNFDRAAAERPTDGNLVNGRIMATVLLPRIVAAYPLTGVGIGNYSLIRNDPKLLRGLPRTEQWDLHGLGLLGYCAELGIPIALLVMLLYAYPLVAAWRSRPWITVLCSYPLFAALFGVQLNFAYPWVVAGLGLAALAIERNLASGGAATLSTSQARPGLVDAVRPRRARTDRFSRIGVRT